MKYPRKMIVTLALVVLPAPGVVVASEKPEPARNSAAAAGKTPSRGDRHLFINKPAIAERARARQQSRPKELQPHAGRGFLLEKVQGGPAAGELDLAKLRRRQLDQVERRPARPYPALKVPRKDAPAGNRELAGPAPGADTGTGFSSVLGACLAAALLFLGLRWRRGRKGS